MMDELITELRLLDEAVARWEAGDRLSIPAATSSIDVLIIKLHRYRDQLVREARDYDRRHKPYDDRD